MCKVFQNQLCHYIIISYLQSPNDLQKHLTKAKELLAKMSVLSTIEANKRRRKEQQENPWKNFSFLARRWGSAEHG